MDSENFQPESLPQSDLPLSGLESNKEQQGGQETSAQIKQCSVCLQLLPIEFFYPSKTKHGGRQSECKTCRGKMNQKYRQQNRSKISEYFARYKQQNPEVMLKYQGSPKRRTTNNAWVEKNRELINAQRRRRLIELRNEVYTAYGNRCSCCGETDARFLSIEHRERDGAHHRRELGGSGMPTYRFLQKHGYPTDKYTLLCMNCNWATRFGDPCPHTERQEKAA
jgi:hypothetical protein